MHLSAVLANWRNGSKEPGSAPKAPSRHKGAMNAVWDIDLKNGNVVWNDTYSVLYGRPLGTSGFSGNGWTEYPRRGGPARGFGWKQRR
jgi:hypothetical protein